MVLNETIMSYRSQMKMNKVFMIASLPLRTGYSNKRLVKTKIF